MNSLAPSHTTPSTRRTVSKDVLRRLGGLVRPHLGTFILAMIGLALGSGINLLFPEIIRRLINGPYTEYFQAHQFIVAAGLIGLFALQGSCFYLRSYYFGVIGQRVVAALRRDLFDAVIAQEVTFFDERRTGDLVSRLHADTQLIQDAVSIRLSILVRYALQVVVGIVLMVCLSPRLTVAIVTLQTLA